MNHRPIMITSNDHSQNLFNGDTGILLKDKIDNRIKCWFRLSDGTVKSFLPTLLPPHTTFFAMTIHKSQGSESDEILMVFPKADAKFLSWELIYTGITRAKKKVRENFRVEGGVEQRKRTIIRQILLSTS